MKPKRLIKELQKQLRKDKDNLVVRLKLAAAYREIGRYQDAIELYHSVAHSYRDSGRLAQAIAVCRSVLEFEPGQAETVKLLAELDRAQRSDGGSRAVKAPHKGELSERHKWVPSLADPATPRSAMNNPSGPHNAARGKSRGSAVAKYGRGVRRRRAKTRSNQSHQDYPASEPSPTPLPAPLAPHEADEENSVVESEISRYPLQIDHASIGSLPRLSLPDDLEPVDDDLLPTEEHHSIGEPAGDAGDTGHSEPQPPALGKNQGPRASYVDNQAYLDDEPTELASRETIRRITAERIPIQRAHSEDDTDVKRSTTPLSLPRADQPVVATVDDESVQTGRHARPGVSSRLGAASSGRSRDSSTQVGMAPAQTLHESGGSPHRTVSGPVSDPASGRVSRRHGPSLAPGQVATRLGLGFPRASQEDSSSSTKHIEPSVGLADADPGQAGASHTELDNSQRDRPGERALHGTQYDTENTPVETPSPPPLMEGEELPDAAQAASNVGSAAVTAAIRDQPTAQAPAALSSSSAGLARVFRSASPQWNDEPTSRHARLRRKQGEVDVEEAEPLPPHPPSGSEATSRQEPLTDPVPNLQSRPAPPAGKSMIRTDSRYEEEEHTEIDVSVTAGRPRPDGLPRVIHDDMKLGDAFHVDLIGEGDPLDEVSAPLSIFSSLPPEAVNDLAERMKLRHFEANELIVCEGDPSEACYVLVSGEVAVLRSDATGAEPVEVMRLGDGALFGEFALLANRRRGATIRAVEACHVYEIPRRLLRELAASYPEVGPLLERIYRARLLASMVNTVPFLRNLSDAYLDQLRYRFETVHCETGHSIMREGSRSGGFYLIVLGSVDITRRVSDKRSALLATLDEGAYFGDMALSSGEVANVSVRAAGPTELIMLSPEDFYQVIERNQGLWDRIRERGQRPTLENNQLLTGETYLT
ncbi:MAG: cyclic nucleotide-binding domain-containing protein [Proteobacteria bacterium]|nr:cyclic nucleotide-binding domain-containing protein [Pseudomonadota bacterium]